ncbi:4530_t:CDS:2 [Gigaspora margarita]|uniref:4530_t:CDS:1 n=1 Tax=Gigaspora margarita TaxID=4874 RepID=A0ABN7UFW7_GIGMA|nr:4530_t:CDS:2 [Gigaspora margarita]
MPGSTVTQCKNLKLERMRNGLLKILEELDGKEGFSSSQRYILDFQFSNRSQIAFFDTPQEEGPISDEDKSEILNCIEKITYIKNLEPSIFIGSYTKSFIRNLIEKFYNDMDEFISQKFDSAFLNHIKDLIDHHDNTVKKLREHLNRLIEELKMISDKKNESDLEDGRYEEIIGKQDACDIIKEKETINRINKDANNEINILKNESNNEKIEIIGEQNACDKIKEKETIDRINKNTNNEINILKDESDNVNDEINENKQVTELIKMKI